MYECQTGIIVDFCSNFIREFKKKINKKALIKLSNLRITRIKKIFTLIFQLST